jgi:hypothetical protein
MPASLMPMIKAQYFGTTGSYLGLPLAGGFIYTCIPGGTINQLQASYTDSTGATLNANPVTLDSNGMANIWLVGFYKIFVYDANLVFQYSVDNVSSATVNQAGQSWANLSVTLTANSNSIPVTANKVILENASNSSFLVSNFAATILANTTGLNGVDSGSLAANSWYHIWAVCSSNGANGGLLSANNISPTVLPANYTYYSYLGALWSNATANLSSMSQVNNRVCCTSQIILSTGSNTGLTAFTFANIVPTTAKKVYGTVTSAANVNLSIYTTTANLGYQFFQILAAGVTTMNFESPIITAQTLYYLVSANSANAYCSGWEY